MKCAVKRTVILIAFLTLLSTVNAQDVVPARIFSNHMVLQRNMPIPVWGYAEPGAILTVTIEGHQVRDTADSSGKWSVKLPAMAAGGPHSLKISTISETMTFRDVLIGEVWLASGQSNMEHALGGWPWIPHSKIKDYEKELKDHNYPKIRMFNVHKMPAPVELHELNKGSWQLPSKNTLPNFSATAWFFAKELQKALNVPIGMIHSSWGGTAIAPWMDRSSLRPFADSLSIPPNPTDFNQTAWEARMDSAWTRHMVRRNQISYSELERARLYSDKDQSDTPWKRIDEIKQLDDTSENWIWLRKEIELEADMAENSNYVLSLGFLNRQAHIFWNGIQVGYILYPKNVHIELPSKKLWRKKNVLLIRLAQPWGAPKVEGEQFVLKNMEGSKQIDLSKNWQMLYPTESVVPQGQLYSGYASYLFNGMVAPIIPYAIRGFLWHQGSSDMARPNFYRRAFPALITGWRKRWGQGNIPFIFVQLPNYGASWNPSQEFRARAPLRQAQTEALKLPNTAMVVSLDIGDPYDVHAANKQDFAHRLVLQALEKVYDRKAVSDGPKYVSHEIDGDVVIIRLDVDSDQLKTSSGNNLCGFELAGADGKFTDAKAVIHNNQIHLTSEKVAKPIEARYAWSDDPECYIYGKAGLPMAPFNTIYEKIK